MTILDYTDTDLQFAHWFRRKREMEAEQVRGEYKPIPKWLDDELDRLRPLRNPHRTCCINNLFDPIYNS